MLTLIIHHLVSHCGHNITIQESSCSNKFQTLFLAIIWVLLGFVKDCNNPRKLSCICLLVWYSWRLLINPSKHVKSLLGWAHPSPTCCPSCRTPRPCWSPAQRRWRGGWSTARRRTRNILNIHNDVQNLQPSNLTFLHFLFVHFSWVDQPGHPGAEVCSTAVCPVWRTWQWQGQKRSIKIKGLSTSSPGSAALSPNMSMRTVATVFSSEFVFPLISQLPSLSS